MRILELPIAALIVLAVPAFPHTARAQESAPPPPVEYDNVVSANPFLLVASWFNAEYEHRAGATATVGLRGSIVDFNDDDLTAYYSGRVFIRYYPTTAFKGFFAGLDAGVTGIHESGSRSDAAIGVGFELGYNWLLGSRRKFYLSLGAGADRLFRVDLSDASSVLPTVRIINVGIGF